jgi:hypothetical protein
VYCAVTRYSLAVVKNEAETALGGGTVRHSSIGSSGLREGLLIDYQHDYQN